MVAREDFAERFLHSLCVGHHLATLVAGCWVARTYSTSQPK